MTSGKDSNKELVHRFVEECWNAGDLARVPEMVAANCLHHDPVFPHMATGVESLQRHIERCRRAFPDLKFANMDVAAEGDEVEVHWTASATQAAEFLGIPATEKRASIVGMSIYRIEGGKIAEHWVKWDLMSLMEQLGCSAVGEAAERWPEAG